MPLKVTIIQSELHWENVAANLEMFQNKIEYVNNAELVVLPEMFNTGFSMRPEIFAETMEGPTIQWMKQLCASKKIALTGSLMIKQENNYYNRLIWMLPNGTCGFYDKRHLFAYGNEHMHYTAGNKRLIASLKGFKINLQVCYDLRFPVWSRQQIQEKPEYDVLIYVANWPGKRNLAWKTLLQARAIENQCYVIGVNRVGNDGNNVYHSGDSMIIDPLGEVLFSNAHEEIIYTAELDEKKIEDVRGHFPFWKDADAFMILNE